MSVVLASAGLVATAACAGSGGGPAAPSAASLVSTTPPGAGAVDRVTWALPYGEPTTLDPAKVGDYSPQTVEANLCDTPLRMKPDFSVGPGLAEKASWTDDHTLVLDLRAGVRFWDGTPAGPGRRLQPQAPDRSADPGHLRQCARHGDLHRRHRPQPGHGAHSRPTTSPSSRHWRPPSAR
ncbi:hypothetical protein ACU686_25330 [Yinghuangia aomiensis]